jgi:hypothetical protein
MSRDSWIQVILVFNQTVVRGKPVVRGGPQGVLEEKALQRVGSVV